jgi:hypothetical protein
MNRREFLTRVGVTSIGLASLPALATPALAAPKRGQMGFTFMVISFADTIDGVAHTLVMAGDGHFTSSQVVGSGIFNHLDTAAPGVPKPLLAFGTWKAKRLISFELVGTYGAQVSGVLDMEINLVPAEGPVIPATLEVICNVGFAGLFTGEDEGVVLTIPDAPFGPFVPAVPPLGLTTFTIGNEQPD